MAGGYDIFYAESGMNWITWVNSTYNNAPEQYGYTITVNDNNVLNGSWILEYVNGAEAIPSNLIPNNGEFYWLE